MGQAEVFEWFKKKYFKDNKAFFVVSDVCNDFDNNLRVIRRCVSKLYAFGYLDIKLVIGKPASYRIKKKYVGVLKPESPLTRGYK